VSLFVVFRLTSIFHITLTSSASSLSEYSLRDFSESGHPPNRRVRARGTVVPIIFLGKPVSINFYLFHFGEQYILPAMRRSIKSVFDIFYTIIGLGTAFPK